MSSQLTIGARVDDAIRAHGRETYPHECCGALIGRDGLVAEILALRNTTEEGPRRRFLVRPSDYREAERSSSSRQDVMLAGLPSRTDTMMYENEGHA